MLALQYSRFGEPTDVIAPVEIAEPKAGPADVVLRMVRSPIHNHDLATIRGVYGYKPELPAVGGSEMLGVVDAIGSDVRGVASGARVATFAPGTWLERVVAAPGSLVPIPDAIDDDRACQLLAMPLSALVLFDDLHVEAGAWVVQNAANGAVGRVFLQVAQSHGVNVVNLVRRESAAAELRRYGARHVVVTADEGWQRAVRDIVGDGSIARIIDSVGGPQTTDLQALLGGRGELIIFGGLERQAARLDPGLMISREQVVRGFWMSAWQQRARPEERAAVMGRIFQMALAGSLPLPVGGTFALSDARAALEAAETPGRSGKILLRGSI